MVGSEEKQRVFHKALHTTIVQSKNLNWFSFSTFHQTRRYSPEWQNSELIFFCWGCWGWVYRRCCGGYFPGILFWCGCCCCDGGAGNCENCCCRHRLLIWILITKHRPEDVSRSLSDWVNIIQRKRDVIFLFSVNLDAEVRNELINFLTSSSKLVIGEC